MKSLNRKRFFVLALLVVVSGFAGGLVSGRLWRVGDANAQDRPSTTTINVGSQGLVFRGPDGRVLAKLSSDANGGVFEVYNANEQPGARMRASSFNGTFDTLPASRPLPSAIDRGPSPPAQPPTQLPWPPSATAVRDLGF